MGPPFENGGEQHPLTDLLGRHLLQWGRRSRTAESDVRGGGLDHFQQASMGPPFENGGESSPRTGMVSATLATVREQDGLDEHLGVSLAQVEMPRSSGFACVFKELDQPRAAPQVPSPLRRSR
jgi:hypothetical protein